MKILIDPKPSEKTPGVKSTIGWDNKEFLSFLNKEFHIKEHEEIVEITIDRIGITVRIENKHINQYRTQTNHYV